MNKILLSVALLTITILGFSQSIRKPFNLALTQMKVVGGDRKTNLKHAGEVIQEASDQGAHFILLPEAMYLGWTDPSALFEAEPVPGGKTARFLSEMAKKHNLFICSGLIEREGNVVYNSAVIINPQGKVILSPSSWAVKPDYDNEKDPYGGLWRKAYKPVAKDFRIWVASSSNVGWMTDGPWKGWKGIGCSMVIGPNGQEVLNAPFGANADTLLYVDIKPESRPGQGTTWHQYWESVQ